MIIETHTHLDMKEFDDDRSEIIERVGTLGVNKIITVGVDLESSEKALAFAQKYESVFAAVGIQPEEVDRYFTEASYNHESIHDFKLRVDISQKLDVLARHKKVVAIGECGLDYHNLKKEFPSAALGGDSFLEIQREKQKDIFRRQLGLAVLLDLPVIIHNREADEDTLLEIQRYRETKRLRGVIHCFTGDLKFAKEFLNLGFYISFSGIITFLSSEKLREVVKEIPLDKTLTETDSPFLAPQAYRGQRNEPAYVIEVVKKIAEIKNLKFEEVCLTTSENAQRLFRI